MAWTALLMGLFGSLHCIGMCGPIALALPYQGSSKLSTATNIILYNSGRILTYGIIGVLPGIIGVGFSFAGQQKSLSIGIGLFFIITALFSINIESKFYAIPTFSKLNHFVQKKIGFFLRQKGSYAFIAVGILNGFLPCGLVYMALAGAMLQDDIQSSMFYMMFFGLGTFPLMMLVALLGQILSIGFRKKIKQFIPFMMVLFGLFFILRGLNVNLPLNVQQWLEYGTPIVCH